MPTVAFVSFPDAPLTENLVRNALTKIPLIEIVDEIPRPFDRLLQFCTYDRMDHELTHSKLESVLSSSYIIRKSLIRKHFLNRTISAFTSKHPESLLNSSIPRTWDFDIAWADELDDLFGDELWELGEILDELNGKWFILKAGMADGGNGIRLFHSKEQLQLIFDEFDEKSDIEDSDEGPEIITSQLRHFVIQEYLSNPLLLDPRESVVASKEPSSLEPYKFHLRAYCVASGALTVYLWEHILALFAGVAYVSPDTDEHVNLKSHLTNTALIEQDSESSVLLLSELAGHSILSVSEGGRSLTKSDIDTIIDQIAAVIGQVFRAALASPVHFQVLPNAFELFGIDLMVTYTPDVPQSFHVFLLEINSEPAIERTGSRLQWTLQDMFNSIVEVFVRPFAFTHSGKDQLPWGVGESRAGFRKCFDERVRT